MEFEHRKDAAYIFGAVVRMKETEPEYEGARYVEGHPQARGVVGGWLAGGAGVGRCGCGLVCRGV